MTEVNVSTAKVVADSVYPGVVSRGVTFCLTERKELRTEDELLK